MEHSLENPVHSNTKKKKNKKQMSGATNIQ